MLFPDRAIAEIETLLLEPGSSWIDDPPKTIGESELQKSYCFHGHSEAQPTTTSAITTPASEDFSDFRFLCCSPQVIPLKNRGMLDGRHHVQAVSLLMANLEGLF